MKTADKFLLNIREEVRDCKIIIAVNKIDLLMKENDEPEKIYKKRCEFYDKIDNFAKTHDLKVFWISAKNNIGIKEMFDYLVD